MHLKSFSTYGFKSFANRTEIVFDKGITAIVGPNGSGKSNVADAIRWVLGEQNAKYLRGSKMEDVIFSGSSKRRALGLAEVTLNLDNSDRSLAISYDSVSLTRRIFRSGESEYFINKRACRLKDILDLMADTGIGKGSMSIIGQNRIDEILNSRPEERRALFEEASGIAKYRMRKKDAVRRLENTEKNLLRLTDICSEVESRIPALAEAAAKTRIFNELNNSLRSCRIAISLRHLDTLTAAKNSLLNKKAAAEDSISQNVNLLQQKQLSLTALENELDCLAENFDILQENIRAKEKALVQIQGKKDVLNERIEQNKKDLAKLEETVTRIRDKSSESFMQKKQLEAQFEAAKDNRGKILHKLAQLQEEHGKRQDALNSIQTVNEDTRSKFFLHLQELLELRSQLQATENLQKQVVGKREALKQRLEAVEENMRRNDKLAQELLESQSHAMRECKSLEEDGRKLQDQYAATKENINKDSLAKQEYVSEINQLSARSQALKRLLLSYEGLSYGIRSVLRAKEPWRKQVIGIAADLVDVEDKYVLAIETALGEHAQDIVITSSTAARDGIEFLKRTGGGRATFLPLDTIQGRNLANNETTLDALPEVCGYAVNLVKYDTRLAKVMQFLLGRILIAENINGALAAARKSRFRVRVVTLDGDVINAGGSLTGGSRKHKEGPLLRKSEIKKAETKIQLLNSDLCSLEGKLKAEEQEFKRQEKDLYEKTQLYQRLRLKAKETELALNQIKQEKIKDNETFEQLLKEKNHTAQEYVANRTQLGFLTDAVQKKELSDLALKEHLAKLEKEMAAQETELTVLLGQIQDTKDLLQTAITQQRYLEEKIRMLEEALSSQHKEIESFKNEKNAIAISMTKHSAEIIELQREYDQLTSNLQELLLGKDEYVHQRRLLIEQQEVVKRDTAKLQQRINSVEAQLRQLEINVAVNDRDHENILKQLKESYDVDECEARKTDLAQWSTLTLQALSSSEKEFVLKISELGPINATAIAEYEEVTGRRDFLQSQSNDLRQAISNLETVINQINVNMSRRFIQAFEKINNYFGQCYQKLFDGGSASLRLSNASEVLASGVEIEVQPPGKKLKRLELLSGGERALTIIALLFALITYKPSPFCVLDEIDAALDDANIQRFSRFLKIYAKDTQFILITHRKGTMESADVMYGITMEESGVSSLLSVKINEKESE